MKYTYEFDFSEDDWERFVSSSPQGTLFHSHAFTETMGIKTHRFFLVKGTVRKAAICLVPNKSFYMSYDGILFKNDGNQKRLKARSERFEMVTTLLPFIKENYPNIELILPPGTEDLRPYSWNGLTISIDYTSYLTIFELEMRKKDLEYRMFSTFDELRQRNIKKALVENVRTEINSLKDIATFLSFHAAQMKTVKKATLSAIGSLMQTFIHSGNGVLFTLYSPNNEPLYISFFGFDKKRAYYMFGAKNPEINASYSGTMNLWHAFNYIAKYKRVEQIDLCGVNTESIAQFKLGFGGTLEPYYRIKGCSKN